MVLHIVEDGKLHYALNDGSSIGHQLLINEMLDESRSKLRTNSLKQPLADVVVDLIQLQTSNH